MWIEEAPLWPPRWCTASWALGPQSAKGRCPGRTTPWFLCPRPTLERVFLGSGPLLFVWSCWDESLPRFDLLFCCSIYFGKIYTVFGALIKGFFIKPRAMSPEGVEDPSPAVSLPGIQTASPFLSRMLFFFNPRANFLFRFPHGPNSVGPADRG